MQELIGILNEISESFNVEYGDFISFPVITQAELIDTKGFERQKSDIPSIEWEYVKQSCGICGDNFSGTMIYIYKDIAISVNFNL